MYRTRFIHTSLLLILFVISLSFLCILLFLFISHSFHFAVLFLPQSHFHIGMKLYIYMKRAWHIGVSSLSGAIDGVLPSSNKRTKALISNYNRKLLLLGIHIIHFMY